MFIPSVRKKKTIGRKKKNVCQAKKAVTLRLSLW